MALSDQYTLSSHIQALQEELLDPTGRWWPEAELTSYINQWQDLLQSQFEFVWGTATLSQGEDGLWGNVLWGGTGTGGVLAVTTPIENIAADILRLDAIYYSPGTSTSIYRLAPTSIRELETRARGWRSQDSGQGPSFMYQEDAASVSLWPPPAATGTLIFEYPVLCTMGTGTAEQQIPPWTRYGSVAYGTYRALARFGPNQNLQKANRYRLAHEENVKRYRKIWDGYFPEGSKILRPGGAWAARVRGGA